MGNVKNLEAEFEEIFNLAQLSSGSHQKSAEKIKSFLNLVDVDTLFETFKTYVIPILLVESKLKCPYVERLIEFIAFTCYTLKQTLNTVEDTDDEIAEHPLVEKIFSFLLEIQHVSNYNVRYRTCQLINKILDYLVDLELSIEFCDNIEKAMLERLNDPKLEVRLEGILALHRFQEIENPLDKIIDTFKTLIEHDRLAKIRRLCVSKIALREDVIPLILSKLRDVDTGVRLAAFTRLSKVPRSLKIEQRRLVLLAASLDSSDKIKSYIESTMLPAWMMHFDDNFHTFMKAIRLDANESDVKGTNNLSEFILKSLFKSKPLDTLIKTVGNNENRLIPYDNLNWETSNYWRILVQHIKSNLNLEDRLEEILPELVHFCSYIEGFYNNFPEEKTITDFLENQFILKQLFTISLEYDLSDPSGRNALQCLIRNILSNAVLTLSTVQVIIKNLERLIPTVELRARYINELISDIMYPESEEDGLKLQLEFQDKLINLKNDLATISRMQESAIAEKDYLLAENLEKKMENMNSLVESLIKEKDATLEQPASVKKSDKATLVKCLDIAAGLLLSPEITKMTSSLETLKRDTIYNLIMHENPSVQAKAMRCYALLCIIDKKTANDGIHLFYVPISAYQSEQECDIQILLVCISAIVDLLRGFGTQLIAAPEEKSDLSESQREDHQRHFFGGTSLTNIIQALVDLMDDEEIQIQETAGHGLCCLVLSNIIQSPSLLSRLVLKWCNPYDQSQKLKQIIGVTFQQLSQVAGFHRQWENTILITLKSLIYTPSDSPYATIDVDSIAKFLVALLEVNLEDEEVLYNFAMRVCQEIRNKPRSKQVLTFSKILNMLHLTVENSVIDELLTTCDELRYLIHNNKATTLQIVKFMGKLNLIKGYQGPRAVSANNSDESDDDSDVQCTEVPAIGEEDEDEE